MDRISTTLLAGYQTEFQHMLNARPTFTEVEDLIRPKYDIEKAEALEKRVQKLENLLSFADNRLDGHEEKM